MRERLSKKEIAALFGEGLNCAQVVLGNWADELGYDPEEAHHMAAAFGGGMFRGDTCGAVSGALIAVGLACADDPQQLKEKTALFQEKFTQRFGSTICRDLIGYDFSKPGQLELAAAGGKLLDFCPEAVAAALEILEEIL